MILRRPFLLAFCCLLAFLPTALPQTTAVEAPADQFFRGYLLKNEAEQLEAGGNLAGALSLYRQMQGIFDGVAQTYPDWQPNMLSHRRSLTQQAIARLEARHTQSGGGASMAGVAPAPQSSSGFSPGYFPNAGVIPSPGTLAAAPMSGPVASPGGLPSLSEALGQWEQAYRQRMVQLEAENIQMKDDLGKWQQWYQWASEEITKARADRDALSTKAADLDQAIKSMEKDVAAGRASASQLEALTKEKLGIEIEYRKAAQRLAAAEIASKESSQKLADASLRVSNLEEERNKLLAERDEAVKGRDTAVMERDAAIQERNAAAAQNLGLKTEVDTLRKRGDTGEMKRLLAENDRLRKDLETAQKQVASLKTDVASRDAELTQLRGQITSLQSELGTLRQQSNAYQTQVAELTLQLKKIQDGAAPAADPRLAEENALLREVVMRQLRSQYRQQQAKELLIAELRKTENVSQELLKQVEELKDARMTLTPEEEKLFTDPQVKEMLGQSGIKGTLMASSGRKTAEPVLAIPTAKPGDPAAALLEKANDAFGAKKFPEAANLYEEVLRAEPKNTTALIGLGYSRQREGKLREAEAALRKCLSLEPDNEAASFHLGVNAFKQERWDEALACFEKGLAKRPQNATARHYLGIIATKKNLLERAEREFKLALAIEPNYGEAHFNLAVLYVTWDPPQWDKARAAYDEALKNGIARDSALETLLKNTGAKSVSAR